VRFRGADKKWEAVLVESCGQPGCISGYIMRPMNDPTNPHARCNSCNGREAQISAALKPFFEEIQQMLDLERSYGA